MVRLRDVADIQVERTSNLIAREDARRKAVISTNVADGYNLGDLAEEVRRVVDPIVIDSGFTVHYGGQFEARQSAARTLAVTLGTRGDWPPEEPLPFYSRGNVVRARPKYGHPHRG